MAIKQWNVRVMREGQGLHIGQVTESTEALARCAALSRYGVSEDDVESGGAYAGGAYAGGAVIYPDEDFEVSEVI